MEEGNGKMCWGRFALIRAGKEISAAESSAKKERCVQFTCSILQHNNFRDGDNELEHDRCKYYYRR
jgi:hypothetical protein